MAVLKSLHWLLLSNRADLVLLPAYKWLTGSGPNYINNLLIEYKPSRNLRSTDSGVSSGSPRIQTKRGEAAFSCQAAHNGNRLAEVLHFANISLLMSFCSTCLKYYQFKSFIWTTRGFKKGSFFCFLSLICFLFFDMWSLWPLLPLCLAVTAENLILFWLRSNWHLYNL